MGERNIIPGTPDGSVKVLKETLHAQQDLLQQLYTELDVEREAAATATDESLSMMLRLQGEKAAVEMEASQYKRIAEEKMVHAEETMATFRDLIYQKEMQIASLEFQVQAYKFKLISLGCNDVTESDTHYPENMFAMRNGLSSSREASKRDRLRRGISLPPNFLKDGEEPPVDEEPSCLETVPETRELDLAHARSGGGEFNCYWEKIKRLDERVKELSLEHDHDDHDDDLPEIIDNNHSMTLQSQGSSSSFYDAIRGEMTPRPDANERFMDVEPVETPATLSNVHDIFEVPQTPNVKDKGKLSPEAETNPWKKQDSAKLGISGFIERINWDRKMPMSPIAENSAHKPQDGLGVEQLYFKRPDVHDFELQQMNRRLRSLEDERIVGRQDTPRPVFPRHEIYVEKDDLHLSLLKSIKDQLNCIEEEMKSWRLKKPSPEQQVDLTSLSEIMLHFW